MKRKITKEKLAKVINIRFPRITNYLKKLNKTSNIKDNTNNIAISIIIHKLFLNTITTKETTDYIVNYLKENYIKEYINLVEINLTIEQLEILIDENKKEYNDLNDNELKLYEVIKKEYKSIEIVE